jgi:parallel beta-helix repeat protein
VWDPTDREGYKRCGWGGIVARGLQASTLANNTFSDLENGEVRKTDGSLANGPGLIHGIYLRDGSSDNTIRGNTLSDISGAAIKFTNGADRNKVRRNRASNTGSDTLVLDHYNPAPSDGRAPEADSRGYDNDRIGRAADGARYIQDNIEGDAYGGSTKRLREFVEKRVEERKKS